MSNKDKKKSDSVEFSEHPDSGGAVTFVFDLKSADKEALSNPAASQRPPPKPTPKS